MPKMTLKNFFITLSLFILASITFFLLIGYLNPKIDDNFLRKYLKSHPEATIFKLEYLDFFTPEDPLEKQRTMENKNKYIIRGDFNKNGKQEIAISGLLSKKPDIHKNYYYFVLILEKEILGYKVLYFKKFPKEPNSLIKNMFLFQDRSFGGDISIGYANNSGLASNFVWKNSKYELNWDSEDW